MEFVRCSMAGQSGWQHAAGALTRDPSPHHQAWCLTEPRCPHPTPWCRISQLTLRMLRDCRQEVLVRSEERGCHRDHRSCRQHNDRDRDRVQVAQLSTRIVTWRRHCSQEGSAASAPRRCPACMVVVQAFRDRVTVTVTRLLHPTSSQVLMYTSCLTDAQTHGGTNII